MVLVDKGYSVTEAGSAEEAIGIFQKEKGKFDLVLSDVVMPGRSGIQMLSPILDLKEVPVLFFSGHIDDKAMMKEIRKRGIRFMHKPFEIGELLRNVEEALGDGEGKGRQAPPANCTDPGR